MKTGKSNRMKEAEELLEDQVGRAEADANLLGGKLNRVFTKKNDDIVKE